MGKLDGVLIEGQTEDKRQESPKPSYNLFDRLVGHSNETSITINGKGTHALIDSGSQITTLSDDLYDSLTPKPTIYPITDFDLKIEGAGGQSIPYIGCIECSKGVSFFDYKEITISALVVPTTQYGLKVFVVVGSNAIRECSVLQ